jgi:hypothetical protein
MILKAHFRLLMVLAALAIAGQSHAAPQTITHQGRLLGSDDKPVADGIYGATFSIWDDPVAGNMVWSEIQDIQTRSGLFSVELGQVSSFFDIFTDDRDLYLQTQVQIGGGMQELSPRLRIGTAPFSSVSRRVHAIHNGAAFSSSCDVSASDSGGVIFLDLDADNDGNPERRFQTLSNASRAACVLTADVDDDGVADRRVTEDCDDTDASVTLQGRAPGSGGGGGGAGGSVHFSASDFSSSSSLSVDLDGDGVLDRRVDEDCDDVSASRSMSFFDVFTESTIDDDCDGTEARRRLSSGNIGSSGQDGVSVDMRCSPDSAVGSTEVRKSGAVVCADYSRHTPFHNSRSSSFFDVFTEMTIDQDCDATGARLAINSKGTSAKRTVACSTDESSSSVVATGDLDGDGLDDSEAALRISPTQSSLAIKTKGTGAQRFSAGTDCDDDDVRDYLDCDDDGDGIAESRLEQRCSPDSVIQVAQLGDGSSGSSYNMRTRLHELEAILKNFGLLGTGRAMQACGDGSSSVSCDLDVDNNSIVEGTAWEKVDNTDASCGASTDSNQDGTPDVSASIASSATRSELKGYFQSGDVPTQSQFSTLLDSDGARSLLSGGMSGSTTATIRMSAAPDSTVFDLGYHGSTTGTIRLMASSSGSDNPIEHSSGAHLTPGGVWTNASDENLKENFQPVDGEEILEKIEQLEITQWNYKNESDEVTHIGPTAQDFQKTFGVGSDGKSISTIDPSGIALVAVKELRKENQELKAQVEELKKMIEELAKKQ